MRALFDPDRHEPLCGAAWDAGAAAAAIERIVADTRAAFTPEGLWRIHPSDAEDDEPGPHTSLYFGAAGVIWALDQLTREGAVRPGPCFAEQLPGILVRNRQALESETWRRVLGAGWQTRSWLFGDAGVLFTQWKAGHSEAILPALAAAIADNSDDPSRELMWGAPGTMLAALALHQATGAAHWADLYRAGAAALEAALSYDEAAGAYVWTHQLYGHPVHYLGPVHGFAGAAFALLRGRALLPPGRWDVLSARFARTLEATAIRGPQGANWPPYVGQPADRTLLLQHCHGAPGMVVALSELAAAADVLRAGGELTWAAGPLRKGAGLCHGTAGNACAFLSLFERTGDERWLQRARAFAMHAIRQSDAEATELGRRRYSLWTGDLGLACFLWECIRASARFPTLNLL